MLPDNRFGLETELRNAIGEDRLHLAFSRWSNSPPAVAGFEALARWDKQDGLPISPSEFIPIAEDSGLIVPLGQWAIGKAAAVLADWDQQNGGKTVDCYFSVNVSAIQLLRDDVAGVVRQALDKHKIGGERLMIELTESAIIGDPDLALSVLSELKALDARVAMDDFGTGYSDLSLPTATAARCAQDRPQLRRTYGRRPRQGGDRPHDQSLAGGAGDADHCRRGRDRRPGPVAVGARLRFRAGIPVRAPARWTAALDFWRQSLVRPIF